MDTQLKIVGVVDGDPYGYRTWSGTSYFFFHALREHGCLKTAISGLPQPLINNFYKLMSFQWPLDKWKFKYHLNTDHYEAMTRKARKELNRLDNDYNHILQIGAWFNIPGFVQNKNIKTSTYQDGNLACLLKSPFGHPPLSSHFIKKALDWENEVYENIDCIFTMSEWLRQSFIKDIGLPDKKVFSVGAGINLNKIPENSSKNYSRQSILFIGIGFKRKGGDYLLEAFKKVRHELSDATLTIIGPQLSGLPEGVECLGFVRKNTREGREKITQAFHNASVFVMPSLYEPFGIVFLEAMAHKLPCIGTNICAVPEIINNNNTGFVVPVKNSDILAKKIIALLKDPKMMEEMGRKGFEYFNKNYTWNRVAEKIISILKDNF